jgi:aminoglycoside 3-N-acetyltransferase
MTVTRSSLAADLRRLGVREGGVVMVHTRMSALGHVVAAAEGVVRGILDALGPEGTVMAYAGWEDHVYGLDDRPEEHRAGYAAEPPVFDLLISEAARENGRIPERLRTWPGAERSDHPEASTVAVGPRAAWLCGEHPADDGYGARSPLARLVEADGQVLMLGAPLETITLLHHAEAIARVPDKRMVTYRIVLASGEEREYTDIETSEGAFDYASLDLPVDDEFEFIGGEALAAGIGVRGPTGDGESVLFPAPELLRFGVAWMEERFG